MVKRIGLFGGSFDPVHHGHLIIARQALEELELDEVWFLPAAQSPFKQGHEYAPAEVRLEMLRVAVKNEPGFVVDERELQRPPPSYAIDTVESVKDEQPDAGIVYLIGEDNVAGLPRWHRIADLRTAVEFVVFPRSHVHADAGGFRRLGKVVDISATEIRARHAAGRSIRYLVPEGVLDVIRREKLYA